MTGCTWSPMNSENASPLIILVAKFILLFKAIIQSHSERNVIQKNVHIRMQTVMPYLRPLDVQTSVKFHSSPCRICDQHNTTGTGFIPSTSVFPRQ